MEKYLDKLDIQLEKENKNYERFKKILKTGSVALTISLLATAGLFVFEAGKSLEILDKKENALQEYANTPEYIEFYNEEVKSNLKLFESGEITREEFAKNVEMLNDEDKIFEFAKTNKNIDVVEKVSDLNNSFEDSVNLVGKSLFGLGGLFAVYGGLIGYGSIRNKILSKKLDRIRKENKICEDFMDKKSIVLDINKDKVVSMHAATYFELENMEKNKEREEDENEK